MSDVFTHGRQVLKRYAGGIRRSLLIGGFTLAVIVLLLVLALEVNWHEVFDTLACFPRAALWPAAVLVVLSYLIYSSFDLLARAYAGHQLNWALVLTVALISYAFNLNLGLLIGGAGFRYRLYTRLGLRVGIITRILGFSVSSNWLGYLWVAGIVFVSGVIRVPSGWNIDGSMLSMLGGLLLIAATTYLTLCTVARKRELNIAGHALRLPNGRMAVLQGVMGAASWATMSLIIYVLFQQRVEYATVLGALLVAGITAAVAHIPGGLGVLEAVFVVMLAERVPASQVLGVLIAYRAIYYLCPLLVAAAGYAILEWIARTIYRPEQVANRRRSTVLARFRHPHVT